MKVLSVYSPKGGVGKSTIAINLAGYYNSINKNVMIVDTDKQKSVESIYGIDSPIFKVVTKLPMTKPKGIDYMIIDHHPSHTEVPFGHFIICPLEPRRLSWDSYQNGKHLFKDTEHLVIVNKVDNRIPDHKQFTLFVSEQESAIVMSRKNVYTRSTNEAVTVFEMGSKYGASKARNEIKLLAEAIEENYE